MSRNVWIIIPAYNEEGMIAQVIDSLKKEGYEQTIVVDDGSDDDTSTIACSKGARVIRHLENSGLGAAISTGLKEALSLDADVAVTFDADGQHDPKEIGNLLDALDEGDFAVGVRKMRKMPPNKRFGNAFLNFITHLLGGPWTDSQSGFRAFGKKALEEIDILSNVYAVSSEITIQVGEKDLEFRTVPIKGIFTEYSRGSGTTIASGINIFFNLLKYKLLK